MRKPAKNSPRTYFTKETENYIVKYNNCTDPEERDRLFREHIYFPLYKLAENIINTYKFYHTGVDDIEDLKLEAITMLVQDKLKLFDTSRGSKAYSYFGTIVKRWLIAQSKKNMLNKKRQIDVDGYEQLLECDTESIETEPVIGLSTFMDNWVKDVELRLPLLFESEQDRQIVDAILTIFRNRNYTDLILQKKALYVYIREITGCETFLLTRVIRKLKEDFYEKLRPLLESGTVVRC